MTYTSQGLMTPADIADHRALTDTARNPECEGHPDPDAFLGIVYCTVAEDCPYEDGVMP